MFSKAFHGIKRFLNTADFYSCLFLTYDKEKGLFVPTIKEKQTITYIWMLFHTFYFICQAISVATKSSDITQAVAGMILTAAYFVGFLLNLDINRDPTPGQLLNFLAQKGTRQISA